jgi:hypothetical protein
VNRVLGDVVEEPDVLVLVVVEPLDLVTAEEGDPEEETDADGVLHAKNRGAAEDLGEEAEDLVERKDGGQRHEVPELSDLSDTGKKCHSQAGRRGQLVVPLEDLAPAVLLSLRDVEDLILSDVSVKGDSQMSVASYHVGIRDDAVNQERPDDGTREDNAKSGPSDNIAVQGAFLLEPGTAKEQAKGIDAEGYHGHEDHEPHEVHHAWEPVQDLMKHGGGVADPIEPLPSRSWRRTEGLVGERVFLQDSASGWPRMPGKGAEIGGRDDADARWRTGR